MTTREILIIFLAVFLIAFFGCATRSQVSSINDNSGAETSAFANRPCANSEICPGIGIGSLKLGMTESEVVAVVGTDKFWSFKLGGGISGSLGRCPEKELNWGDHGTPNNKTRSGIRAFLTEGKVSMIKVDSFKYSTSEGISTDAEFDTVRNFYPNSELYSLRGSGNDLTGPFDLLYLIDSETGIAFEFYRDSNVKRRLVSFVFVFPKGHRFFELAAEVRKTSSQIHEAVERNKRTSLNVEFDQGVRDARGHYFDSIERAQGLIKNTDRLGKPNWSDWCLPANSALMLLRLKKRRHWANLIYSVTLPYLMKAYSSERVSP